MSLMLATQEDVYVRFGGQEYLTQALDPQRKGIFNQAMMNKAIADASEEVAAYCQVQVDLTTLGINDYPQLVTTLASNIAVYYCWKFGSQGRAVPIPVEETYNRALDTLAKISRREVAIGAPSKYPAMNQVVTNVNFDDTRDPRNRGRITYSGFLNYFC